MSGARTFDPYNVVLLRAYSQLDCRVLVHADDVECVHRIPNMLRLKRDLRVSFLQYDGVENVKCGRWKSLFPCGGLAVMETGTLIGCPSGMQSFQYFSLYRSIVQIYRDCTCVLNYISNICLFPFRCISLYNLMVV